MLFRSRYSSRLHELWPLGLWRHNLVRSARETSSKLSNSRMPTLNVDGVIWQRAAALPKCSVSDSATSYSSCLRLGSRFMVVYSSNANTPSEIIRFRKLLISLNGFNTPMDFQRLAEGFGCLKSYLPEHPGVFLTRPFEVSRSQSRC